MSFINDVLDVYDDLAAGLAIGKSEIAKLGSKNVTPDVHLLPDSVFALNILTKEGSLIRKYPLKTPDDTALSVFYFTKLAEDKLPENARKVAATFIKAACEYHKVSPTGVILKYADSDIKDNVVKLSDIDGWSPEENLQTDDYALITDDGTAKYPINNSERVKIAASYFRENYKLLAPNWRHQMAENITKKAAEFSVEIPHEDGTILEKYASDRYSNILQIAVNERLDALQNNPEGQTTLQKLVEKRASMKPIEFARALEAFDQLTGLNQHWDRTIIDPYQSTFGGLKIAQPIYAFGKVVSREKIAALATAENLQKHFDPDFIKEFQKEPVEIFQSLPSPDQKLMVALMEE